MNQATKPALIWSLVGIGSLITLGGCSESATTAGGKPISAVARTDEQKAFIQANDQAVEDAERGADYKLGKKPR